MDQVAITFDVGQVLVGFDAAFLAEKLTRRGWPTLPASAVEAALPAGWVAYGEALRTTAPTAPHGFAWKSFVRAVLAGAGVTGHSQESCRANETLEALVDALWLEQRTLNLWRRPVPGMIDLVRALHRDEIPVAVVSNSEGALQLLLDQLGWTSDFPIVVDSGCLGIEKPDPRIFAWAAGRLGVRLDRIIHIGDSWVADIEGALGAGARAIWFPASDTRPLDPRRVRAASDATEVERALREMMAD